MMKKAAHLTFSILLLLLPSFLFAQDWQNLFNGENLSGWKKLNGNAHYEVKDEMIVGTAVPKTPNTFLATEKNYGDFILEVEVKVDLPLNSGIQIRSLSKKDYNDGRVHGYQVEIDPSPRAFSGGIYDEGRRGWLYPLGENEAGRKAFKNGEWNHYRIEAIGNTLRTWVNGVNCANLVDDLTAKGFIALQVHSIPDSLEGKQVRWRNIKILTTDLEKYRKRMTPNVSEENYVANSITESEARKGWRLLWDGKTSEGWRSAKENKFPKEGWVINDGVLTVQGSSGEESAAWGDIITTEKYSSFELKLQFMITEGANSGIKYFVDPALNKGEGSSIGLEFQILDDEKHPDAKEGVNGNRQVAALYDLIPAANLTVPGRDKEFRGVGEWNNARIVVRGNHIEHWLNGFKTLEYERNTPMYRALVAYSKYKVWPNFGESAEGHILLQEHGDTVHFRSIKIREF